MGMNIDFSKPLSDDEKQHLRERGLEYKIAEAPAKAAKPAPKDEPEPDGYGSWTKEELKAEAEERGLPINGTKDDLVARLEADDEEDGE